MEAPNSFNADAVRSEKAKVIEAIRVCQRNEVSCAAVRGQYGAGRYRQTRCLAGYREEPMSLPDSNVETYVAMKLAIDNWRWSGVPFYIRTGKRLARREDADCYLIQRSSGGFASRTRGRNGPLPTGFCCAFSPMKELLSSSAPRFRVRRMQSGRCANGFQVQRLLRHCASDRIRNSDLRRDDW